MQMSSAYPIIISICPIPNSVGSINSVVLECWYKTIIHLATLQVPMDSSGAYVVGTAFGAVLVTSAERFHQHSRCSISVKCAPNGTILTGSNRIFTTCSCRATPIRVCTNPFCQWRLQAGIVHLE